MKAFNLIGSIAIAGLLGAEILPFSSSVRALEPRLQQQLQAAGSYRCADSNGRNVVRVRLTETNGVPSTLFVDLGNTVTSTYDISDSSKEGDTQSYTAYDGKSNLTYKFIEYPRGKGRLIFSLEAPNGEQKQQSDQKCYKIGVRGFNTCRNLINSF